MLPRSLAIFFGMFLINFTTAATAYLEKARMINQLKNLLNHEVTVIRNGKPMHKKVQEIVVGDLIHLSVGDYVPADCIMVEPATINLQVDEYG